MGVELVEYLSAEEVAADTADDADSRVDEQINGDQTVYRAVGDRVYVRQTEIKLNGGEIRDVIGRCTRQVEHRGRSAGGEETVECSAECAGNNSVRNSRLDFDLLAEKEKIDAEDYKHHTEKADQVICGYLFGEVNRNRNRDHSRRKHRDRSFKSDIFAVSD